MAGVEIVGVGPTGVETVGAVTLGTVTLGTETVGRVSAGLEGGGRPTRSTAKPDRIPQTAILRALPANRLARRVTPTRTPLQPPYITYQRYPSRVLFNRTQFESIGRLRHAREPK